MQKKIYLVLLFSLQLCAFSTTNVQLLYGTFNGNSYVYDTKNGGKTTVTLEHYSAFKYGDVYGFLDYCIADDRFKYHDDKTNVYGEIAPRLDLGALTSSDLSFLFVNKVFAAFQYNTDFHHYKAYLYGLGSSLNIYGFEFFNANVYRKDKVNGDDLYQLTLSYKTKPFLADLYITGFTDWTNDDLLTQNQLLYPFTESFSAGAEWHYYTQKTDTTSNAVQVMLQYKW
ncbi:MAG: outer membrane protein OmpK [Sulfurimonas sp.]